MSMLHQRPKHKPSPKHTLDEVLKSLQDLIRNDLVDAGASFKHAPAPAARGERATAKTKPAAAPAPSRHAHAAATPPVSVEKVLDSLRDLIMHELADANAAASVARRPRTPTAAKSKPAEPASRAAPATQAKSASPKTPDAPTRTKSRPSPSEAAKTDVDLLIEAQEPATTASATAAAKKTRTPRGGLQTEFPFNPNSAKASGAPLSNGTGNKSGADGAAPAQVEVTDAAHAANESYIDLDSLDNTTQPRAHDNDQVEPLSPADMAPNESNETPSIEVGLADVTYELEVDGIRQELEEIVAAAPPESVNWDDIPVLEEIAAHPDEELELTGAAGADTPTPLTAPAPAPSQAREIAVKVVAKLNIELRKCGERTLDPRTIDRLQYVLREALETEGKKGDNAQDR